MLDIYGRNNGFGWKLNEIVGAQVVSVPMAVPLERANKLLQQFMLSMLGVFVFLFISMNIMVHIFVTQRITKMSAIADKVSLGQFEAAELDASGSDEISTLARSFGRMRTSLTSAMKMLEE
jgi:protein-histidine pros-kinase